ncbi:MAG: hypothetical protein NW226_09835 [Microscillaceae bacterium]|nr:hypothetical protein [Microscillaceae bacterium]
MKTLIHTPTNKLENSLDFYQKLGLKQISEAPIIFTDGKAVIEINPDRFARPGIKLYQHSWEKEAEAIKEITALSKYETGYLLSDPSGVWIYLEETELTLNFEPSEQSFSTLGNYAGLSIETTDIQRATDLYEKLGFTQIAGAVDQGFVSLTLGDFGLNLMRPLMCPHLFFNPSMTYFNGKINNPIVIESIRALHIPITEEITHFNQEGIVDNIIVRDPGGYGFFIFND